MDHSLSAFLIGAGIGAYGFLHGNKAFQDEMETEKTKRSDLLIASRQEKFSLEKRLKQKEEEVIERNNALTAEKAKVQAYAADKKTLKIKLAQANDEIMVLKLNLKDHDRVLALQSLEIAQLTAALKAEREKSADLQIQLTRIIEGEINEETALKKGEPVAIAAEEAAPGAAAENVTSGKAENEGRLKSILSFFI